MFSFPLDPFCGIFLDLKMIREVCDSCNKKQKKKQKKN